MNITGKLLLFVNALFTSFVIATFGVAAFKYEGNDNFQLVGILLVIFAIGNVTTVAQILLSRKRKFK